MKKILLVLAMLAVSVFIAQPAISAEGDGADTPTTSETTTAPEAPAAEEPAAEEPAAEAPAAEAPAAEAPAAEEPAAEDAPAATAKSAPDGDEAKKPKDKGDEGDGEVAAAAGVDLNAKVTICHVPPGEPENAHPISVSYNSIVKGQGHGQTNTAHAGDWIPAFQYMDGDELKNYPGRNAGQANPCDDPEITALIEVGTQDPLLIAPTCSADGFVDLPTTLGVNYVITPSNAPGEVDVDATAATGYVLADEATIHWDFTVLEQLSGQVACPEITSELPDSVDVKICHADAAFNNPYHVIPPATAGVAHGHDTEHNGPIFNGVDAGWGDIIEPYVYNGVEYPGQNWTAEGEAIYDNGCEIVAAVVPTPPTVTDPTCDLDGTLSVPEDTEGIDYSQDPEGTGPGDYLVTATANTGFFISGQAEFPVTVEPKLSADDPACVTGGVEPTDEEDGGLLPDTGGSSLLLLVLAGSMMAAGFMVLAGRKPVGASLGHGMIYSPLLPPTHAVAQSWMSKIVAAIKATFRGDSN